MKINITEIRNYLVKEINWNELMSKKHKKVCRVLNYVEQSLILISTITGCVFISAFASLVGILIGITSSAIGLKISAINCNNFNNNLKNAFMKMSAVW